MEEAAKHKATKLDNKFKSWMLVSGEGQLWSGEGQYI